MRYLKYFESSDEYDGLTPDFIHDMFIDISDDFGYDISVLLEKRSVVINRGNLRPGDKIEIGFIPYILVIISSSVKSFDTAVSMKSLLRNEYFKEILDVANDRVLEFGWYISDRNITNNSTIGYDYNIYIKINRIMDKEYSYLD